MSILNTRKIKKFKRKNEKKHLQMLTCYDYQTAKMLNETELDLILVGDSLGNVILGYDNTVEVTLNDMITFSSAVKRGAKDKFVIADMPFGTYATLEDGLKNAIELFQKSKAEAIKLEGATDVHLELIKRLTEVGIPVMAHIGLTPQSVHQLGGYYTHGKTEEDKDKLINAAKELENHGAFAIVLECVEKSLSAQITDLINIPTIGIGSGLDVDGQVLVINDLLKIGPEMPPSFCTPIADLYQTKKELIESYLQNYPNE
jgi:3-methyl-2-oxobutanoate hydroxymethyltransferase